MKGHFMHALGALRSNAEILVNSSMLACGSIVASGTGFVYWWVAAREFPPAVVGTQAALISAMALVGMLGDAGFSTLLLGEAGRRGRDSHSLMAAAALAGAGTALLLAVLAAGVFRYEQRMTGLDALLFIIGCALTGFGLVIDNSFIGLGQSRLQFVRSLMFSVLKLILLAVVGLVTRAPSAVLLTWVVSLALTLALSCGYGWARGVLRLVTPDVRGLMKEIPVVIDHHLLNLSAAASGLTLPLVVSFCLGPAVTAAFYAGWMVRTLIMLLPGSLTTVLFSLDGSAPEVMRQKLRFSLMLSLAIGGAGLVGFVFFGDLILRMFNPSYPHLAGAAMPMFGIGLIGSAIRQHYVLLARVRRKMMAASLWLALGGFAELALATLGGLCGDVRWLALGWVVALSATATILARPLFAYLRPPRTTSPVGLAVSPISRR
jgi:O-antigen/teichoic acid export membrane protein